jgi:hypothetical protein
MELVKCQLCAAYFFEYLPKCTACGAENLRSAQWSKEAIQEFESRHSPPLEIIKITICPADSTGACENIAVGYSALQKNTTGTTSGPFGTADNTSDAP